ncbi:MAG: hypothetical protein K8R25_08955 [Methanosarcinales archaeon]|nr:hypothetical protein [Methanosarcinales archaeon]
MPEYHSIGEGFEFGFFPMSILTISVIAGLVYAIIKTGKYRHPDEQNPPFGRIFLTDIPEEWRIRRFVESSPEALKRAED